MYRREFFAHFALVLVAVVVGASPCTAQTSTGPATRFIVGFPAGGSVDIVARLVAERVGETLGTPAIVENVSGAGGRLGVERVKQSAPDGFTVLVAPAAIMTLYPHIFTKLSYVPATDFIPVAPLCMLGFSLVVSTSAVPDNVKTLQDLIAWFKANSGKASYASGGTGTPMHFIGAMLAQHAGLELTHVAYRGAAPMIQDAVAGQVPVAATTITDSLPHIETGKLRPIAATTRQRSPFLPNVPTFVEAGAANIVVEEWFGLFVPAGTPEAVVNRLNAAVAKAVSDATVKERLRQLGLVPLTASAADFAQMVKAGTEAWAPVVEATGFKIDE
jgi:tripartite-type tricarboxylate transporter receptor subunit TctC